MSEEVQVWTDGACWPNPGPGGWGALLVFGNHDVELSGGEAATTNNRMEMTAAVEALRAIVAPTAHVRLHSDSQYLTRGMTEWMPKWQKFGLPEKNRDLWQELVSLSSRHRVEWQWVRGHAGHERNHHADRLAAYGLACGLGQDGNVGFKIWLEAHPHD